ncbi:MAG: dehydrogenase, short-chain alcohol dehydrogenase like protein [Gammaproteobacteria bacterium]|jgi:NAD(P)-dependent dehydrogenase (short-subunit alcohol dehydrogenase family)|nr:dehydrogenase, short-chain alcohol dehydrogenase like protein [Gammaproteobacteria bacterium]
MNLVLPPPVVLTVLDNTALARDDMQLMLQLLESRSRLAGPIRRQGAPEDIAGACAWLLCDEADYFTGQTSGVNGGRYI